MPRFPCLPVPQQPIRSKFGSLDHTFVERKWISLYSYWYETSLVPQAMSKF
ncbi:predicted protein [Plenodomus lingam JN3]|uniref:Predicted protein n=1 Tax=Leptosphaeria maculans (strain JN3 / isolate v23.1.3 / race Av1-4-5-6-7-8) TaxID=985895 RepID=E4ZU16_LEPMJ|nr:predicted protein [Plenodomus lingam JN3]CBX94726.1 predicted protein [Plenodomus lingam JN3]